MKLKLKLMKMNMVHYYLISMLFFLFSTGGLSAQQLTPFVVSSSGGFYSNTSGMLSFTTGEMSAVETFTSPSAILTQGFQQIWELGTSTQDNTEPRFSFSVNPNPSDGRINLSMDSDFTGHVDIHVIDLLGREIMRAAFEHEASMNKHPIDLSFTSPGMYLMTITIRSNTASVIAYPVIQKIQIVK